MNPVPIININVLKNKNLDFEDFVNTVKSLNGIYSVNSSCMTRSIKIVFTSLYFLFKFLCLNFYIEKS